MKNTQLGGIDNTTRFYLIWRFTYGNAKVLFDDASKLSRAIGFDIEANWDSAGIVKKNKQFISIKGPVERRNDETFQRRIAKHFPDILQETLFDDEIIKSKYPGIKHLEKLGEYSDENILVFGTHFATPSAGYVRRKDDHFIYEVKHPDMP